MRPFNYILLTLLFLNPSVSRAHGGGLNKEGCHNNRKTGDYHCHGAPREVAQPNTTDQRRPFRNCTEARAAGAAPVMRGDPRYGAHLDSDGDGIGCEPYRGRQG